VGEELVAAGKSFLKLGLKRGEVAVRVVPEITERLRPAEALEEGFALVGAQDAESVERSLVEVVILWKDRGSRRASGP
jgi:hypothetical protein